MLRSLTRLLITIFAIYDVQGIVVLESPSHRTINVGTDMLVLECVVRIGGGGERVTELTWARQWPYEDDFQDILQIPLPSDGDKKPFYRDFSLKSRTNISVSAGDDGEIKVTVLMEPKCSDEALYRCDVTVLGGPSPPTKVTNITVIEDPLILSLSQGGRFECMAVLGNPPGKLVWLMVRRQGAYLHNVTMGGMMTPRTDQPYCSRVINSVLTAQVTEEDESIICAVISGNTSVQAEKDIVVPFPVKKATISGRIGGTDLPNSPEQVSAVVGQSVVLNCSAKGRPEPVVKWQHWAAPAWLELDNAAEALVLPDVDGSEEGRYRCEAENYVGGARHRHAKEIFLRVKQNLDDEPQLKNSSNKVTLVVIFIVVVVMILSIALCVLIAFGRRRHHKRAKRKHKPIYNVEMEYRPIVKNTGRRSFTVPPPLLADDDFRI